MDQTTLQSACNYATCNPAVTFQWVGNTLKNNTLALAVTGNEVHEETTGDKWKKGGKVFSIPQPGKNTSLDAFTLTKFNSLKVLTVKPEGGLEIKGI